MKKASYLLLLMTIALSACGGTTEESINPIQEAVDPKGAYLDQIEQISQEWDDALELADHTGRGNLPPRVAHLQEVRRRALFMEVPESVEEAHGHFIKAMNHAITAYMNFMSEDPYQSDFEKYREELSKWNTALNDIK